MSTQALFIGHTYIDVTLQTDHIPAGDEKTVAEDYAVSFGGNAVTAAFCSAALGTPSHLCSGYADDWLGKMFADMAAAHNLPLTRRHVARSALSFIMPNTDSAGTPRRAIVRCRDTDYQTPIPKLNLQGLRALHIDGHQTDAALHYARLCQQQGILTSLDGGSLRENTEELLEYIDVAVCSERLCQQMDYTPQEMLIYLAQKGCKIAAVTQGEQGVIWREDGGDEQHLPALKIPKEKIVDTSGAGDIFHGAYVASFCENPQKSWEEHFKFARAASTHAIQFLGNEASLPTQEDIKKYA